MAAAATMSDPSRPLLPRVAAGDEGAMRQLVQHFSPLVRGIARRASAGDNGDDLVQETMVRLWRFAHRFDPARGGEPSFVAAVARHAAIDLVRRRASRPAVPTGHIEQLAAPVPSASDRVETAMTVRTALAVLTEGQRELVRLAYFEHLTQPEIAVRLGLPLGTVKSRTFHALRVLRAALRDDDRSLAARTDDGTAVLGPA